MREEYMQIVDDSNWESFTASGIAVLMVTNAECNHCKKWKKELADFLAEDDEFTDVRFGVVTLEQENVVEFEKANKEWLDIVEGVPFNAIYVKGEPVSSFYGEGIGRLRNRLKKLSKDGVK